MTSSASFQTASPYQGDILALPVEQVDVAADWYAAAFGMRAIERRDQPHPAVVLERDGVRIGFAVNGGDPAQNGAAIRVAGIRAMRDELEARGIRTGNWRVDQVDGQPHQVFFVVAPDGLCFYFHEPLAASAPDPAP